LAQDQPTGPRILQTEEGDLQVPALHRRFHSVAASDDDMVSKSHRSSIFYNLF